MLFDPGRVGRQSVTKTHAMTDMGGYTSPSLDLVFDGSALDPRITFTRASTGTYFDSGGVMQTAPMNVWLWSGDMSNAATTKYGNISAAPVVTANQTIAPDGTLTAARVDYATVSSAGAYCMLYQGYTVPAPATYTFSVWLKGSVGGEQLYLNVQGVTAPQSLQRLTLTTQWQRISFTPSVLAAGGWGFTIGTDLRDGTQTTTSGGTVYVWGAQIEVGSSATTYIPTTTVANGAPRFDYDPVTHALRGLLIEEARTNVAVNSQSFTAGGWGPVATTLVTGQSGAPDGTATLTRVVETTASSAHYVGLPLSGLTASATYTFSVYAQAQQDRYLQLAMDDGVSSGGYATFDLQTGTISGAATAMGTGAIGTARIQAISGGTYRCSMATTIGTATGGRVLILTSNIPAPAFAPGYVGNAANGLLIWGAQLEAGTFPSSYIVTGAGAVTRANDYCMIPSANVSGWFVSPGGSWSAEFINLDPTTMVGKAPRIVCQAASAGSAPLWENPLVLSQFDGAVLSTANTIVPNVVNKGASTWAVGSAKICLNAGAIATSSSLPNGYPQLTTAGVAFLASGSGIAAESMTGYIRRVRYWPRVLSDAEMQSVTT